MISSLRLINHLLQKQQNFFLGWWNWFDLGPDDGDFITWMEENNDFLMYINGILFYRVNVLNGGNKTKVRGAYGTTSGRSVINLHELSSLLPNDVALARGFYAIMDGYPPENISTT